MWFVYILECSDKTYYTGITKNISNRIQQHNAGKGAKYTRSRIPVRLVWYSECLDKSMALQTEHAIKSMKRLSKERMVMDQLDKHSTKSILQICRNQAGKFIPPSFFAGESVYCSTQFGLRKGKIQRSNYASGKGYAYEVLYDDANVVGEFSSRDLISEEMYNNIYMDLQSKT